MPVLMIATYNEDGTVDVSKLHAITFDPYTHGYYEIGPRVGEAFKDGIKIKKVKNKSKKCKNLPVRLKHASGCFLNLCVF